MGENRRRREREGRSWRGEKATSKAAWKEEGEIPREKEGKSDGRNVVQSRERIKKRQEGGRKSTETKGKQERASTNTMATQSRKLRLAMSIEKGERDRPSQKRSPNRKARSEIPITNHVHGCDQTYAHKNRTERKKKRQTCRLSHFHTGIDWDDHGGAPS